MLVFGDLGQLTAELGDLTGNVKYYTDAAVLYQYVIAIMNEKLKVYKPSDCYEALNVLHTKLLKAIGGIPDGDVNLMQETRANKRILFDLRTETDEKLRQLEVIEDEQEYIGGARSLFQHIAGVMRRLLSKLYEDAEKQLSIPPPCRYAIIGLGSLALQQITPYSDLEFAILLESDDFEASADSKVKHFFTNLSHLVNFKTINLGETSIPMSKYGLAMDELVRVGVNFDLGGKTPLGRTNNDKPYTLIRTVDKMMDYVRNDKDKASHIDKNLPYILENVCYVHGDEGLASSYKRKVKEFLNASTADGQLNCEMRAVRLLKEGSVEMNYLKRIDGEEPMTMAYTGDLENLRPKMLTSTGRYFNVKQEIYRLPDRLTYNFGLYFGVAGASCWDTVDQLTDTGIITKAAAKNLQMAVTFATVLRLQTYSHHRSQSDDMSIFPKTDTESWRHQRSLFKLNASELSARDSLFRYFFTALPLHEKLQSFCRLHKDLNRTRRQSFFQGTEFFNDHWDTRGYIHIRLAQFELAKSCLEKALTEKTGDIPEQYVRVMLENVYRNIGHFGPAIEQYLKCLEIEKERTPLVSLVLDNLGLVHLNLGDSNTAIEYLEKSLDVKRGIYKDPHHKKVLPTLNYLGLAYQSKGDYEKAMYHFKLCLPKVKGEYYAICLGNVGSLLKDQGYYKMALETKKQCLNSTRNTFKDEPHEAILASLNNLGVVYLEINDFENAMLCFEELLQIGETLYGAQPYQILAECVSNLGAVHARLGHYDLATAHYKQSLAMFSDIHGNGQHLSIAFTLNSLGLVQKRLGDCVAARNSFKESLDIVKAMGIEEINPFVSTLYNNLGLAYGVQDIALFYFEKALLIDKTIHKDKPHLTIATTLSNLGSFYKDRNDYQAAIEYFKESLTMRYGFFADEPHTSISNVLNNLGSVYTTQGQYDEAMGCFDQSLQMYRHIYKTDIHPDIATVFKNLGQVFSEKGQYSQALKKYEESLKIWNDIHNQRLHPEIALTLSIIGTVHCDLGEYDLAIEYGEKSLQMRKQFYQDNDRHLDFADSYNNLGSAYSKMGQLDKAIEHWRKSLDIARHHFPVEPHLDVAKYLNNLALAFQSRGEYAMALGYHQESLEMKRHIAKDRPHPDVAIGLSNLGCMWQVLERHEQAIACFNECQQIYEDIYRGARHPNIATNLNNLGFTYMTLGDYDRAIGLFQASLDMKEVVFENQNHPSIADSAKNLGSAFLYKGQADRAKYFYEKAYDIEKNCFKDQPNAAIGITLSNLGSVYRELGQYDKAKMCYNDSLETTKKVHGDYHLDISDTLTSLGNLVLEQGQSSDQAISYFEESLRIQRRIFSNHPRHSSVANTLNSLGNAYEAKSEFDKSIKYYKKSLKMRKQIFKGNPHPEIAESLNNLGYVFQSKGHFKRAEKQFKKSLQMREVHYQGAPHPDVVISLVNLGSVYECLGKYDLAIRYGEMALEMNRILYSNKWHPMSFTILKHLVSAYGKNGDYVKAARCFLKPIW